MDGNKKIDLFNLDWGLLEFYLQFSKGNKKYPFRIKMAVIPEDELLEYERKSQYSLQGMKDGSLEHDRGSASIDVALFDGYVKTVNGKEATATIRECVPVQIKTVLIRSSYSDVGVELDTDSQGEEEVVSEDFDLSSLNVNNTVVLTARANGEEFKISHVFNAPDAKDSLDFQRAVNRVKTIPGRKRKQRDKLAFNPTYEIYGKLYRKLIKSTGGYCLGEETPCGSESTRKVWIDKIPYYHMKVAVAQLFGTAEKDPEEGE